MFTAYLQNKAITHAQRVCRLYKRGLRTLKSWHDTGVEGARADFRYQCVLLRARFDENKNETDFRKARELLLMGEKEAFEKQHPQPMQYDLSPGGVAYDREYMRGDWLVDLWHPIEKARYPQYFARREQRKQEYIDRWTKQYGDPLSHGGAHH